MPEDLRDVIGLPERAVALKIDDQVGARRMQRLRIASRQPEILFVPDVPDPVAKLPRDVLGPVGGGIVDDDGLDGRVVLVEHRADASLQRPLAVEYRDDDGNQLETT